MYSKAISHTYLSDATINIRGFTSRYLPLPHPMSKPIDPGSNFLRNLSTMGHGCKAKGLVTIACMEEGVFTQNVKIYMPCSGWKKNAVQFADTPHAHAFPHMLSPNSCPHCPHCNPFLGDSRLLPRLLNSVNFAFKHNTEACIS